MIETATFHPFVLPFMFGMVFVLGYCLLGFVKIMYELPGEDRIKFFKSLLNPKILLKDIKDIFYNCLLHIPLWRRNKMLGYMHSSIAFGWFMLIVLGHIEVFLFVPQRANLLYFPIFFNYFVAETEMTVKGAVMFTLMDTFLLVVLSGIVLAIIKRVRSRIFGMRRTTRLSFLDNIGLYSLWAIFPLRLLAESFTAGVHGGSFLTLPMNWLFRQFLGNELNMLPTWWAYSIALCVFMCVLPFTRYMHIPAEILLIPMRNAGLKVRHSRRGFSRLEVYSCPACGVCIDACPMSVKKANIKDTTVYLNRQIRRGNEKRIEEISDKCLLCGKCSAVCQVGVEGPVIRIAQRAVRKYGINQDYSDISVAPMAAQVAEKPSKVLYFAGCMTHLTPGIKKSTVTLLEKAGVDFQMMDGDGGLCCGRPMLMAGRFKQAKELVRKNTEIIRASGCDTLLLSCPICYKIFNEHYKLDGIRVVHHSVYLAELIYERKLNVNRNSGRRYVFHDPCELGRGSGIYEQPRKALATIGNVVEARANHRESICCGGSLGSLTLGFDKRKDITLNSLKNLTAEHPDRIVTACPLCQTTFSRYSDRPVIDIAQAIEERI